MIFGIGCPASDDHAVDAQGTDRKNIEQAHIDVGQNNACTERNNCPGDLRNGESDDRRNQEQGPIGRSWNDGFLKEYLRAISKTLKQTDRKSVVLGKRVSVREDIGGRLLSKKKKQTHTDQSLSSKQED